MYLTYVCKWCGYSGVFLYSFSSSYKLNLNLPEFMWFFIWFCRAYLNCIIYCSIELFSHANITHFVYLSVKYGIFWMAMVYSLKAIQTNTRGIITHRTVHKIFPTCPEKFVPPSGHEFPDKFYVLSGKLHSRWLK